MQTALVLAFDARQTIFGKLTRERPGLIMRAWDMAELRQVGKMLVEVRGGQVDLPQLFGSRLAVKVQPEESGPDHWRGWLQFEPGQLAEIPILRAIRDARTASSKAVVQYQGGGGSMRLDLRDKPKDALAFQADLRQRLVSNGITATLRLTELSDPIEAWNPPPLILP